MEQCFSVVLVAQRQHPPLVIRTTILLKVAQYGKSLAGKIRCGVWVFARRHTLSRALLVIAPNDTNLVVLMHRDIYSMN